MKLQFEDNEYYLMKDGDEIAIATTDESFITELGALRLSLKNCQAIENGYDLDELALKHADLKIVDSDERYYQSHKCDKYDSFKDGFQKALAILGDKKFSETELYRAFLINSAGNNTTLENTFKEVVLPMFQQTEWDCVIDVLMTEREGGVVVETPKLDANNCLILKRK